jgi:hypothetical protein
MRILFDQGTPVPIRRYLQRHEIRTAAQEGWDRLTNGELLDVAENRGFDIFLTTDKNIRYQQNLASRRIAIIVLMQQDWRRIRSYAQQIVIAVDSATSGSYVEVDFP